MQAWRPQADQWVLTLSAVATGLAALATWRAPRSAALLAESYRHEAEKMNERRRMKLHVFSTLMQERATIASIDSVRMLNSIDFVFFDSPKVREAWADLYGIFGNPEGPHPQLRSDKVRSLLKEMAVEIGLSDNLRIDDIARIYYPNALAQEEELQMLRRTDALNSMRMRTSTTTAEEHTAMENELKKFPPRPTS